MTCPIIVEPTDGQFEASVVGVAHVRATAPTREQAIVALREELDARVKRGELLFIDLSPIGLTSLAGKYADDPTLRDICEQAYRERDAELNE